MKHNSQGFSLIELMAVLIIIGLLMAVGIPAVQNAVLRARISTTEQNLRILNGGIKQFQMDIGALPSKLKDLVQRPTDEKLKAKWRYAYVEEIPEDPWNSPFVYRVTNDPKLPYELYSHGPNGPGSPKEERIGSYKK
jgi:general secretion pathway protein G